MQFARTNIKPNLNGWHSHESKLFANARLQLKMFLAMSFLFPFIQPINCYIKEVQVAFNIGY